jgi:hypothetical protein
MGMFGVAQCERRDRGPWVPGDLREELLLQLRERLYDPSATARVPRN